MMIEIFHRRNWMGRIKWYFRLVAANGEPIAQSEAYSRRIDCEDTARLIKDQAQFAQIEVVR